MTNQMAELHDSELAVLWYEQNDEAILIFSSFYIHESEGEAGVDEGIGWFQRAELVIENATETEFFPENWSWSIVGGETEVDGILHKNGIPLPLECKKSFRIYLEVIEDSGNGAFKKIEIKGSSATLTLLGKKGGTKKFSGINSGENKT
ncbi:MAG: hypothetical protein M3033_15255 [Acidobacteriota bacterium]|nr:hypothetical protein [Acidobacteriota bacterium]